MKLWLLLNSAFGLWLLSSVFITFGTWKYTQWSEDQQRVKERSEKIERIDQEIESRFAIDGVFSTVLGVAEKSMKGIAISQEQLTKLYAGVLAPPPEERSLFPEYSKRGLLSLMKELSLLLEGNERQCVELALLSAQTLSFTAAMTKPTNVGDALTLVNRVANHRWTLEARLADVRRGVAALSNSTSSTKLECGSVKL